MEEGVFVCWGGGGGDGGLLKTESCYFKNSLRISYLYCLNKATTKQNKKLIEEQLMMCAREWERVCVCVCVHACVHAHVCAHACVHMYACVCMCVWERKREVELYQPWLHMAWKVDTQYEW